MTVGKGVATYLSVVAIVSKFKVECKNFHAYTRIKTNVGWIVNLLLLTVLAFVVSIYQELA